MSEPKFEVGQRVKDGEIPPNHGRIIANDANNHADMPVVALMQDVPDTDFETVRQYSAEGLSPSAMRVQDKPLHHQYPELNIYALDEEVPE